MERVELAGMEGRFIIDDIFREATLYPAGDLEKTVYSNPIFGGMRDFDDTFRNRLSRFVEQLNEGAQPDEIDALEPEVRDHDPREALVAGPSGLETYEPLLPAAFDLLRPDGCIVAEIGHGQVDAVRDVARTVGFRGIEFRNDFQGIPRVLVAERPARGEGGR